MAIRPSNIRFSLGKETAPLLGLFLAAALVFIVAKIASEMLEGDFDAFDRAVLLALRQPGDPAQPLGPLWLQAAARDVTSLGSTAVLTILTLAALGFLMLKRAWTAVVLLAASVIGGTLISTALKNLIERPRPDFAAAVAQTQTYSFPSGHAFLSAVVYLTIGALLARVQRRIEVQIYILSIAVALTLLVGSSRVYLGVHWPTDVIAGWCAGAAWSLICWSIAAWLQAREGNRA